MQILIKVNFRNNISEKDLFKVRKQIPNPSLVPPAITVCPWAGDFVGWKGETELMWFLRDVCGAPQTFEELQRCVAEKSYGLNETVDVEGWTGVVTSDVTKIKPTHPSHWNSTLTTTLMGMCHTMVYPEPIDKSSKFVLTMKDDFLIFLHDPNFFLLKSDNFFVPYLTLNKPAGKGYRLKTVTKKRMNRAGRFDCQPDSSYNFGTCVKSSVAKSTGCNSPWSDQSVSSLPICNTTKQLSDYEALFTKILFADQPELQNLTGCLVPCTYQDYSLMGSSLPIKLPQNQFFLLFVTTDILEDEEVFFLQLSFPSQDAQQTSPYSCKGLVTMYPASAFMPPMIPIYLACTYLIYPANNTTFNVTTLFRRRKLLSSSIIMFFLTRCWFSRRTH